MTALASRNFPGAIQSRLAEGRIPRFGPILMLFARSAFILIAQGITFLLLLQLKSPKCRRRHPQLVARIRHTG